MPSDGGNRMYDLWNVSPNCQVKSVRVYDIVSLGTLETLLPGYTTPDTRNHDFTSEVILLYLIFANGMKKKFFKNLML